MVHHQMLEIPFQYRIYKQYPYFVFRISVSCGYSHTYSKIYSSPQSVLDEYNECNDKVKNAIEVPDYNSHLFRFPGGLAGGKYAEIKKEAKELLLQNNIVNVDWNALTGDAETNNLSVEFEMTRLTETMESKNSLVILMHDAAAKSVTADALPQIIANLFVGDNNI